ncbi:hypothetical protein [Cohnella phaseoli]|uniref:FkbM family methyltransferase n=1 Tax=Cohnella phaseoli TaxID=456490 RepID=A0A3D9KCH4_9BACL|nr:hypothetical protein [Cohnella phaseoli]RED83972.1 FkbM family methyltransferase [Cohnella phaseoli]
MRKTLQECINQGRSPFESRLIKLENLEEILQHSDDPVILYGAGGTCSEVLKRLFKRRILPFCITDSDPLKSGTSILHIPVLTPEDAIQKAGPNAICIVAIWSAATFYHEFIDRLNSIGYQRIYFLDIDFRPRLLPQEWVEDVRQNETMLLHIMDKLSDDKSKKRFEGFIYSNLTSKLNHCGVLGSYKSLDGDILHNDLISVGNQDVLVHCRNGFKDDNEKYLCTIAKMKEAYLFEPTWAGRTKTKEYLHQNNSDQVMVFPYLLGDQEVETDYVEKIFFSRFIDQEEYRTASAHSIRLDMLAEEIHPTMLHLDMSGKHIEALHGAQKMITENKPLIILSGFLFVSEVINIIQAFPQYSFSMRYFGGITMREGYTLIINANEG